MISEKTLCSKVFTSNLRCILHENDCNYNSYRFSYKFAFILFLSFLTNQKPDSGFQQVDGLATRNISAFSFIATCAQLQSHAEIIDFYKEIFLHVIPASIVAL